MMRQREIIIDNFRKKMEKTRCSVPYCDQKPFSLYDEKAELFFGGFSSSELPSSRFVEAIACIEDRKCFPFCRSHYQTSEFVKKASNVKDVKVIIKKIIEIESGNLACVDPSEISIFDAKKWLSANYNCTVEECGLPAATAYDIDGRTCWEESPGNIKYGKASFTTLVERLDKMECLPLCYSHYKIFAGKSPFIKQGLLTVDDTLFSIHEKDSGNLKDVHPAFVTNVERSSWLSLNYACSVPGCSKDATGIVSASGETMIEMFGKQALVALSTEEWAKSVEMIKSDDMLPVCKGHHSAIRKYFDDYEAMSIDTAIKEVLKKENRPRGGKFGVGSISTMRK